MQEALEGEWVDFAEADGFDFRAFEFDSCFVGFQDFVTKTRLSVVADDFDAFAFFCHSFAW